MFLPNDCAIVVSSIFDAYMRAQVYEFETFERWPYFVEKFGRGS